MSWLTKQTRWIMLISGVLTCTVLQVVIAPESSQRSIFGAALSGPVADVIVRSWGTLVVLVGLMLIYGAFHPPVRRLVLTVAGVSKLAFITLVFLYGRELLTYQIRIPVILDAIWVVLFALLLVGAKEERTASAP